uniref:Lipocalin/cytosolic fatty-acid binding domain-containing protein n=1 Tax=Anopheles melas TaxID=34690 RepID=A0A182TIN7_9DIPT
MIVRHVSLLVSFILGTGLDSVCCSICLYHGFHSKFFTDLNFIIEDFDSASWYVVAYQQPDLPYRTPYHLPQGIAAHRNCYSYTLRTRLGVILMELVCREVAGTPYETFEILTRPNGMYIIAAKGQQEVHEFRIVHVMQLTKTMVLLVSCSTMRRTYGVLVLNRAPPDAEDEGQVRKLIESKLPDPLYPWMNFTVTSAGSDGERCRCGNDFVLNLDAHYDKRKGFVLVTLAATIVLLGVVKILKRFL